MFWKLLTGVGNLSSHFVGEVFFLLFNAFTLDVVNSINELHAATELLGGVGNVAFHAALEQVGANEVLLQQADFLIESGNLTGSDLFLDLSGLVSHLGIVVHQSDLDGQLVVDSSLGNQGLIPVLSAHSGDLHSNVLANFGSVDAAFHSQVNRTPWVPPM